MDRIIYFLAVFVFCVNAVPLENSRIVNGEIAANLQFPYAVSLQQLGTPQLSETRGHRCGGALITYQHALTVANCVFDIAVDGSMVPINPAQYRVFAGASLLTNDTSADRFRPVANFTVHPSYTGGPAFLNNIAIITVTTPFPITAVTPIALPASDLEQADFTKCTVAGWGGLNVTVSASTELRFANKYIYSQSLCTSLYNSQIYTVNIMPTMVCAASLDLLSAGCTNDYGNPLVCNNTLTGVLWYTDQCRISSFPEVYTRVSNYTTWIRSISASTSVLPSCVLMLLGLFIGLQTSLK